MAKKENKGGELTNEQIERDLRNRQQEQNTGYTGSQDTGEKKIRELGSDVQRTNGEGKSSPEKE